MESYAAEKTSEGRQRVGRNGHHPGREVVTGIGKVEVQVPKVRSREGEPVSFQSSLVPPETGKL